MCKRWKTGEGFDSIPVLLRYKMLKTNIIQYRITRDMADDRKKGISFSFSKKVTTRKNILNSDDARTKEEETDYINAAEGKGLIR